MKALSFLAVLLWASVAGSVNLPTIPTDYFKSTALTVTGTVAVQSNGTSSVLVSATGTGTGLAFTFQCFDGVNWVSINAFPLSSGAFAVPVTTGSANGDWLINPAGCAATSTTNVRVNLTAITGGTETFTLNASAGSSLQNNYLVPGQSLQLAAGSATIGALTANQSVNVAQFAGTNAVTGTGASGSGIPRVTISNDSTLAANQSVNIAQINAQTAANGGATGTLLVEQGCAGQTVANTTLTPFSLASTTALKLLSKVSSKSIYICAINIVSASANNVALIAGTKTTNDCDTSTAGLAGGTTAATGWNFAANGGLTAGNGQGVLFKTASQNIDVCLLASGSGQVSGTITSAQF